MDKLLTVLMDNPRLTDAQIAQMTGMTEEAVGEAIADYERRGVICGYKTIIDWDKLEESGDSEKVTAIIELKVTPRRDTGFEKIAEEIMAFDEVESVSLMSGGYDFSVGVTGHTFKEVALFVAKRLAPIESVISTQTTFILKRYKRAGIILSPVQPDERGVDIL